MKDIKPIGIEHLQNGPITDTSLRQGGGLSNLWNIYTVKHTAVYGQLGLYVQGKQIRYGIVSYQTTASTSGLVQIATSSMWAPRDDFRVCVFGFRYKPGTKAGPAVLGLKMIRATTDGSTVPDVLIHTIPANSPENYYEIVIRPYTGQPTYNVTVYRDGELIATKALDGSWTYSSFKNGQFTIGTTPPSGVFSGGSPGDYSFSMEDMYTAWSDQYGDEIRQGPIQVKRVPYETVDPGLWTPVGGKTPKEILNLAGNSGSLRTDYLASDPTNTVVKCKLDTSVFKDTELVVALGVSSSAWRSDGTAGNLSVKWKDGVVESAPNIYMPTNAGVLNQLDSLNPTLTTTPGGVALTKTSMAALELVVTPSA